MYSPKLAELVNNIQPKRLINRLDQLGRIGGNRQNGVTRLAFTDEDKLARGLLVEWMREAGLEVRISPIGNIFGRLNGASQPGPVVMVGSHADSVVRGGKFDGPLGVIAAIEAAQIINDSGIRLGYPLEVVCFVMEESTRFDVGYAFGSKVMSGQSITEKMLRAQDSSGKTLAEAVYGMMCNEAGKPPDLKRLENIVATVMGYVNESRYPMDQIKAFVELHIEQGPVLVQQHKSIGAVTAIAAPTRLTITLTGEQNHSGTTPMATRRDALAGAAEGILAVERICNSTEDIVGTVGVIRVEPNVMNIIPGKVVMKIDLRSISSEIKGGVLKSIQDEMRIISGRRGLGCEFETLADEAPQILSPRIISLIEDCCSRLGIEAYRLASGAGHDAAQIATRVPDTGMIFVPSRDGISHDPREYTDEQGVLKGTQVLLLTLLGLVEPSPR